MLVLVTPIEKKKQNKQTSQPASQKESKKGKRNRVLLNNP